MFFGSVVEYFARRPHSRLALVRLIVYLAFAAFLKVALDMDTLVLLLAAMVGVGDLGATASSNTATTPINSPRLGAGREMPPALRTAALAVSALLPGPIPELFERWGVDGLWALVRTAEKTLKSPLSSEQLKAARNAELNRRLAQ